jgi:DNA-binding MltR family transcriptional regulator
MGGDSNDGLGINFMWLHKTQDKESVEAALKEIETSTDRAAAIVAVAFVEDHLTMALRRRFVQDEKALDAMFNERGALGAYGAKSELAYLVGMFSDRVASDLNYLRKIRNKFAHNVEIDSFSSPPVKDWAMNLKLVDYYNLEFTTGNSEDGTLFTQSIIDESSKPKLTIPRGRFIVTCQCLLSIFILDKPPKIEKPHA